MSRIANVLTPVAPAPGARHWTVDRPALLSVQLLGQLKVRVGDVAVDDWPSGRGRSLFKYLVTHRHPWPRRWLELLSFSFSNLSATGLSDILPIG